MSLMTPEEIERGLINQGVPAERARAVSLGIPAPKPAPLRRPTAIEQPTPGMDWPLRLTLPWSHLVSDNQRSGVLNGRLLLTPEYRRAKGLIRDRAKDALGSPPPEPVAFPLSLHAKVWVPDDTRAHDVANFAKATHDALESVVYTKDRWLYRVTWERAGVDVDAPRAELTIKPLAA